MKFHVLALLPLGLVLSSCFPDPYYSQQGPPPGYQQGGYGNGGPYNSYGGNGYRSSQPQPYDGYQQQGGGYQTEQGTYEQIGPRGATRQNNAPPPDVTSRPISPSYEPDGGYSAPQQTPPPRSTGRQEYPTAEKTDKPGLVRIPYPPYNIIDVNGIKSGGLAQDPTSGKKFRVP